MFILENLWWIIQTFHKNLKLIFNPSFTVLLLRYFLNQKSNTKYVAGNFSPVLKVIGNAYWPAGMKFLSNLYKIYEALKIMFL